MGVYKRLVFCQKLPPKSQFSASKLEGGRLLEHGRLLEILRYFLYSSSNLIRLVLLKEEIKLSTTSYSLASSREYCLYLSHKHQATAQVSMRLTNNIYFSHVEKKILKDIWPLPENGGLLELFVCLSD